MLTLLASPRSDSSRLQSATRLRTARSWLARRAASFSPSSMARPFCTGGLAAFMGAQGLERGQLRHQVIVHHAFGPRGVALFDGGHQDAVLVDGIVHAARPVQ